MTTPAFNPIGTLFNSVRYYTQFDPYYYTVDNRPLTDISNNSTTLSSGVDAARRAVLMEVLNRNLRETAENSTASDFVAGLAPSAPSGLTIRMGVGEILTPLSINNSISQTILKRGINQSNTDLVFTAPGTVGQSVVYTVEYKYVDIGATTSAGTHFFDSGNSSLFDTSLNGTLVFQLKQGTATTTGSETIPATTSGWSPLYNFHVTNGQTTWYKLYLHANAPKLVKDSYLLKDLVIRLPNTGAGTVSTALDPIAAWQLADEASQSIVSTINLSENINLYKDINFDVNFASTTTTGNINMQLSYAVIYPGATMAGISFTSLTVDSVANPGTANTLSSVTLTNGKVPGWALNSTSNTKKILIVKLTRTTGDTSTGNVLITNITARQN